MKNESRTAAVASYSVRCSSAIMRSRSGAIFPGSAGALCRGHGPGKNLAAGSIGTRLSRTVAIKRMIAAADSRFQREPSPRSTFVVHAHPDSITPRGLGSAAREM